MPERPILSHTARPWTWGSLLVLPLCYQAAAVWARTAGGAFWLWFNLDPDYFYLLDALNVVNLTTPGHVYHPGTTVQWLAALILEAAHPGAGGDAITTAVLADPESHLALISGVFVALNALGALVLGAVTYRVLGDIVAAWLVQLAPVISMVVLKHSYHVKPEALLLLTALMLAALAVASLAPGRLERRRAAFAMAFGLIAGFGVATKVTALPVFVLPLFVLWVPGAWADSLRACALYGVSALLALVVFTLPAAASYDVFFAWMAAVSGGSGAYGGGSGFIDWAAYPGAVVKLFKRPAFHVVFVLALLTLAWAWRRRRQGRPAPPGPEARLLGGIVAAQLAHVLLVAKQPNALYLLPSLALIPLAFVLVWRLGRAMLDAGGAWALGLDRAAALILAALVVAQGFAVGKLVKEQAALRETALSVDNERFARCARVYTYAASSPSLALLLADFVTGSRFASRLARARPSGDYWLEHWWTPERVRFRGWAGPLDMSAELARYPCVMLRGGHWPLIRRHLPRLAPGLGFGADCSTRHETIKVAGAACDGGTLP